MPEETISDLFQNPFSSLINQNSSLDGKVIKIPKTVINITANVSLIANLLKQEEKHDKKAIKNLTLFVTFSIVATLSLLINLRVFHIVFVTSKRKSRPANILVAHLSSVVIGLTCVLYRYVLEKTNILILAAPGICHLFSLLGNSIANVFSLNIGVIIWLRTRSNLVILRKSLAYRAIGLMWTVTLLANLPTLFMEKSTTNPDTNVNHCKQIPLLGSFGVTITYESLRLLLFNVMVCAYLIQATLKVRSSINLLANLKSEKMIKRMRKVRYVQFHTIVLIFTWFPHGLGIFLYKILTRFGWNTDYVKYLTPLSFLGYAVFILCPLSYVILFEEMTIANFFAPCFQKTGISDPAVIEDDDNRQHDPEVFGSRVNPPLKPKSDKSLKGKSATFSHKQGAKMKQTKSSIEIEHSWLTTVEASVSSVNQSPSITRMTPLPYPIQLQRFIVQASTSAKLESVSVDVHLEPGDHNAESETLLSTRDSETLI